MRFEAVGGQVIVCDSREDMELLAWLYHPDVPLSHWKEKSCLTSASKSTWKLGDAIPDDL